MPQTHINVENQQKNQCTLYKCMCTLHEHVCSKQIYVYVPCTNRYTFVLTSGAQVFWLNHVCALHIHVHKMYIHVHTLYMGTAYVCIYHYREHLECHQCCCYQSGIICSIQWLDCTLRVYKVYGKTFFFCWTENWTGFQDTWQSGKYSVWHMLNTTVTNSAEQTPTKDN